MIDCEQLFPFNLVEKGSKIIIYGMGNFGRSYLGQVLAINYCDVLYISDKVHKKDISGIPYISPDNIRNVAYDKVVVAIYNAGFAKEASDALIELGVSKDKIIVPFAVSKQKSDNSFFNTENPSDTITVGLILEGGLGDYVVFESLYEKIRSYSNNIKIILYGNKTFIDTIFNEKETSQIWTIDEAYNQKLDLILHCRNSINVDSFNQDKIRKLAPKLYDAVKRINQIDGVFEMGSIGRNKDSVLLARAKFQGKNRFSFLAGDSFDIKPSDVKLVLDDSYKAKFESYNLKKYITFNCWSDTLKEGKSQIKVWSKDNYEAFIKIFKEKMPDYDVVQIGALECPKVSGADKYILGEHLKLAEHVLMNSSLHIDCEGGLVHIATALGTKCMVLFGPTPLFFYSYPQNVNITAGDCNGCMGLIENWPFECIRGLKEPECMHKITPEMLISEISKRNLLNE